jgi:hypothetical protein
LIGKFADDALVLRGGFVGLSKFAIAFGLSELRRRRNFPVLVELRGDRLIILNLRVQVAICLFLK